MSVSLQEGQSIQFSDNIGNISHQGVLGSNINQTSSLSSTFPTTPTGTSLGHYHYTETGSNALKFLNVCGTGTGGHQFFTSNSTTAPFKTATIDQNGMTIDKSTQGSPILLSLPNVTSSIDIVVICASNINIAPYNMTPVSSIWPVQVNSNCTNMTTGITYYAKVFGTQQLQLNTNPDGGVGTIIDTTDLASRTQPILSLITGYNMIPITSNMNETLTITNDTDVSILSATDLTFNGTNVKMNQVTPTLIYSSTAIYADGQPPATSLLIRNTYGYSGWYYKNIVLGQKINWYFPPKTPTTTQVSALKGISISFFNGANTSNDNTLFVTIYTVPTGSGDYAPGFFHSSNTYVFDQTITPVANTNYQGVCIIDKSLVPFNYETQIQYEPSTVNNPRGSYLPTDNILAVVIGTNSSASLNSVELVVNKLNLHYDDFTQSYLLIPP